MRTKNLSVIAIPTLLLGMFALAAAACDIPSYESMELTQGASPQHAKPGPPCKPNNGGQKPPGCNNSP
ncbi:hypothetical protein [Nannocystis sp. SCPEA4]|uniref:hypothetical protein n=1 Tax=Nannocystis sp. SCPEA4 TaxID=2996787 RepID=UPI00226E7951|nr:hypothetical protein [Nannocystis sp. SCPEA4]MCY1054012.1 hypothetical protein [Nannocystis sp. SCPEA4]